MRRRCGLLWVAAAVAVLTGCSNEAKKEFSRGVEDGSGAKKEAAAPPKKEQAPDVFTVTLDTTKGPVAIEIHRDWAPLGADHFYSLVKLGFYDGDRFFRYVKRFIVQFGINGDPKTNSMWSNVNLPDDPVKQHNVKGTLTYATAGPRTRSTQMFINLNNNSESLDKQGFSPIGKVVSGMDIVESFYSSYGDMPSEGGEGPDPGKIETQGNSYLESRFPRLDYIKKATIQ